jgi:type IV pilus assembly protein PilX
MTEFNHMTTGPKPISRQRGAALIVSLVLLTIITLLSVSAMRNTNLETQIAVNHQFKELSFQAAENALAKVTAPSIDPALQIPAVIGEENALTSNNFFQVGSEIEDQAPAHADVTMTYQAMIDPSQGMGNMLFSGFQLDVITHLYQADSHGYIAQSGTQTHNRMQVALIRQ